MATKTDKYLNYGMIAGQSGLTVNELKVVLRKKGYLKGHQPTEKALRSKMAVMRDADPEHRFYDPKRPSFPVWNETRLMRILKRSGLVQDPRFLTKGFHNAADNLTEIAKELAWHFGYDQKTCAFEMSYFLTYCVGKDAASYLASNMTHGGIFAMGEMYEVHKEEDCQRPRRELEAIFRAARNHETDTNNHLDAAERILDGIEDFLKRKL